jgi:hypothetical protein
MPLKINEARKEIRTSLPLRLRIPTTPSKGRRKTAQMMGLGLRPANDAGARSIADTADVWIVRVTACAPLGEAILDGEKLAVAPAGRPLAAKVTVPG